MVHNTDNSQAPIISYGIMGNASMIPAGFQVETVIALSLGVNQAMQDWGDILLKRYDREREAYKRDYTLQTLGYSTDNGEFQALS